MRRERLERPVCDPRLLAPFLALAEELHFGRAAERLHLAQPSLSQQIKRLELQLGVALFERTRARVSLTDAGRAILPHARAATEAADAVARIGHGFATGDHGHLRVGLSGAVHHLAQAVLDELTRAHPAVSVTALQDSTGVLARAVAAGDVDVALGVCSPPMIGVSRERLRDEPVLLAVDADHPLADRNAVRLAELSAETFALADEVDGAGYNAWVTGVCRAAGFEPRLAASPRGPMAWEIAVRARGCVGLTTRLSAISAVDRLRLIAVVPPPALRVEMLTRDAPPPGDALVAGFVEAARRAGARDAAETRQPAA